MEQDYCLNCSEELTKNYCANCGQKSDTHRITIKHFVMHDLLHGVWHFEKGMLFTLREALLRPGQAALDYISGKRIRYYNVFYLCLVIIGLNLLLNHTFQEFNSKSFEKISNSDFDLTGFLTTYLKIFMLSAVPILALNAKVIFKRLHLNIAEHFILSGLSLLGMLIFSLLFVILKFINSFDVPKFVSLIEVISFFLIILFPIWSYYDATRKHYHVYDYLWRILLFYAMFIIELMMLLWAIVILMSDNTKHIYFRI